MIVELILIQLRLFDQKQRRSVLYVDMKKPLPMEGVERHTRLAFIAVT